MSQFDPRLALVLCVPVQVPEGLTYNPPDTYVQRPCPFCGEGMWVGPKSLQLMNSALVLCVTCAFKEGFVDGTDQVQVLNRGQPY